MADFHNRRPMFQLFLEAQTSTKNYMEYTINWLVSKIEDFERNRSRWIIQRLIHLDLSSYVVYYSLLLILSISLYLYIYILYIILF